MKSLKINENQWESLEIIENHWKSMKIIENAENNKQNLIIIINPKMKKK